MPIVHPVPCAGQCGKKLRLKEVSKPMCEDCQEGAALLNQGAIRLAKEQRGASAEAALAFLENPTEDLALYNIVRRNAGWAIQWYSAKLEANPPQYQSGVRAKGLFVNRYYPTFTAMVEGETKWVKSGIEQARLGWKS